VRDSPETDAKTDKQPTIKVEVTCERWGSSPSTSVKIIDAPMIGENAVRLDITLDIRKTDSIVIRPVRRDLDDIDGLIEDAQRLANT